MLKKEDFIGMMRQAQAPLKGMLAMIPADKLDWVPTKEFMTLGQLLKHLSENWCIIKMMATGQWPSVDPAEIEEDMKLENMTAYNVVEALEAMDKDLADAVAFIENEVTEEEFFTSEVSAPWGFKGKLWQGVMMARDHQINHKMQLHQYLKLLGKPVNTQTLYQL